LKAEPAVHRRASELLGRWCPKRRFEAIVVVAGEGLPVQLATRVLGVSESGYYDALTRPPSARSSRHAWLTDQIREIHLTSHGTYGARRVHAELVLGRGLVVSHGRI
jgi:putative transposase